MSSSHPHMHIIAFLNSDVASKLFCQNRSSTVAFEGRKYRQLRGSPCIPSPDYSNESNPTNGRMLGAIADSGGSGCSSLVLIAELNCDSMQNRCNATCI
jgi:hypothetical protein